VLLRTVDEPPLEDFIELPAVAAANRKEIIRWSNGVLLEVKNRTLPRMLQQKSSRELMDLATRIEKTLLDLDLQAEQCKNRAQGMVEQGQGDPTAERELAVLYRQRIEVFKPIVGALKLRSAQAP
jgi:hypothetical protein